MKNRCSCGPGTTGRGRRRRRSRATVKDKGVIDLVKASGKFTAEEDRMKESGWQQEDIGTWYIVRQAVRARGAEHSRRGVGTGARAGRRAGRVVRSMRIRHDAAGGVAREVRRDWRLHPLRHWRRYTEFDPHDFVTRGITSPIGCGRSRRGGSCWRCGFLPVETASFSSTDSAGKLYPGKLEVPVQYGVGAACEYATNLDEMTVYASDASFTRLSCPPLSGLNTHRRRAQGGFTGTTPLSRISTTRRHRETRLTLRI